MTHLLLTSIGLSSPQAMQQFKVLQQAKKLTTCVIIANAHIDGRVGTNVQLAKRQLESCGISVEFADIRDVACLPTLNSADIIYIAGGNTFKLLSDVVEGIGLQALTSAIKKTKLTIGVSAGSIVLTPTIRIAGAIDPDENNTGLTDLRSLDLVHDEFLPHYDPSLAEAVRAYETTHNVSVIVSKNEDAHVFTLG